MYLSGPCHRAFTAKLEEKKGVGASLVRGPYCQLDVGLCDVDVFLHWNSAAEEGAGVGLKLDLQGGTGFNLLRVHFWAPVQRKRV